MSEYASDQKPGFINAIEKIAIVGVSTPSGAAIPDH